MGQARLHGMIANRPDWCVSRQRNWGVPIPLFVEKETGELHPDTAVLIEKAAQAVEKGGIEAWFAMKPEDFGVDGVRYAKLSDTLDVWFDSGTTHFTVLRGHPDLAYPADLYLEGSDQHRGWFHSSLLTGCALDERAPYKGCSPTASPSTQRSEDVEVARQRHRPAGGVRHARRRDPQALVARHGLLRRALDLQRDPQARRRRATGGSATRFGSCSRTSPTTTGEAHDARVRMDRARPLRRRAGFRTSDEIVALYDRYEFHVVAQKLTAFASEDLGAFYLDLLKDRLYTSGADSKARRSAQNALYTSPRACCASWRRSFRSRPKRRGNW